MKLIGLDVGYGFVKVTDGNLGYSFPSIIGDSSSNTIVLNFEKQQNILNNLRIEFEGKNYWLGKSSIKHSNYLYRDLSLTRDYGNDFEILFFGALSLFHSEFGNYIKVVTGLPPERMHLADKLINKVKGERALSIFHEGKPKKIKINVSDVEVVPQPLGTYWSEFANAIEHGEVDALGKIGIIDIGFRTSDFAVIQEQEYISEKSRTIPIGMCNVYKEISSKLSAKYGIYKESHSLDEAIIKRGVKIAGKTHDISDLLDECFEKLSQNIIIEMNSNWMVDDFDQLVFTGGGSHSLSKFLLPYFSQSIQVADPFTANSRGYLNWANYKWSTDKE